MISSNVRVVVNREPRGTAACGIQQPQAAIRCILQAVAAHAVEARIRSNTSCVVAFRSAVRWWTGASRRVSPITKCEYDKLQISYQELYQEMRQNTFELAISPSGGVPWGAGLANAV